MASLNLVMLIGYVGRDAEVRYLDTNKKVAQFSVATSEGYKDNAGNWQTASEWHNIVAWGALADFCEKYVKKGTALFVQGRLRTRSWTDQQGQKKYATEVIASNIQFAGSKPQDGQQPAGDPYIAGAHAMAQQQAVYHALSYEQQPQQRQPEKAHVPLYEQAAQMQSKLSSAIEAAGGDDLPF